MIDPGNTKHVYFFADIATVIIDPRPGSTHDTIVEKPTAIIKRWSCLIAADMFTVDAALPNPANHHEVYFFSGSLYALVDIFKDKIVNGPKTIIDEWPSLRAANSRIAPVAASATARSSRAMRSASSSASSDSYSLLVRAE